MCTERVNAFARRSSDTDTWKYYMHHRVLEANQTNGIIREYNLLSTWEERHREEHGCELAFQSAKHITSGVSNSTFFNFMSFKGALS